MSFIKKLLGFVDAEPAGRNPAETRTVREIVDELDHLPQEQAAFIAAFAFILSRVAHADMDVSATETKAMERIVVEHGGLSAEQAMIVVQMSKTQNLLFGGTENFPVTQEFNRIADRAQKMALLDCMFAVSAADHDISGAEDKVIRQVADELLLEHADFIEVRTRYRDHLSVLKEPGERG